MGTMLRAPRCVIRFIPRLRLLRRLHGKHDVEGDEFRKTGGDREESLHFYKSRGQHILVNPRILDAIVRKSAIGPTDTVLEIGPGTGNLTVKLLEAAQKVVAIEIDERMVEVLDKRVVKCGLRDKLMVIHKDAMRAQFPQFDLVVANIPYGISSSLVIKLVYGARATWFRSATLLLQKEFARRLLANPGDSEYNRLAVNVNLVADVEFVMDVSKRDFLPRPKVDSSVVIIRPKAQVPNVKLHEWRAFTRTCFTNKNKTLGAIFKMKSKVRELLKISNISGLSEEHVAHSNKVNGSDTEDVGEFPFSPSLDKRECLMKLKEKIIGVLKTGGFEDKRPSKLSHEELLHLLSLFNQTGIYFNNRVKLRNEDRFDVDAD